MIVRIATKEDSSILLEFIEQKADFDRSMKGFSGEISTTIEKIERTLFGDYAFAHALILERNSEPFASHCITIDIHPSVESHQSGLTTYWLQEIKDQKGMAVNLCWL
ncbi:hypothetical protein VCRA2133E348_440031 [Vibrio crassostreae]|nr:hypothetical protein VCRA2133E348_440031 [Vibrio crassostreae]